MSPTSNIPTNESIFKSSFYIHPKKKKNTNWTDTCLIHNLIPKSVSFFGFLLFQQLFSAADKMWKVNGFLHHLFPHLKTEADVSHLHGSPQCAATRGQNSLEVYYRGPVWDVSRPKTKSARCVEGKLNTNSCTFNKSKHIRTLWLHILLSAMGTHSGAQFDQVYWWDLAVATQCAQSTVGRKTLFIRAATNEGILLSMCEAGENYNVRLTKLHPDARERFAVYFRFLPWWGWC